jgi:hypothetical protein
MRGEDHTAFHLDCDTRITRGRAEDVGGTGRQDGRDGVGAEYSAPLCDLGVFMDQPTEPISSDDLDVGVDRVG